MCFVFYCLVCPGLCALVCFVLFCCCVLGSGVGSKTLMDTHLFGTFTCLHHQAGKNRKVESFQQAGRSWQSSQEGDPTAAYNVWSCASVDGSGNSAIATW